MTDNPVDYLPPLEVREVSARHRTIEVTVLALLAIVFWGFACYGLWTFVAYHVLSWIGFDGVDFLAYR